jgi:hypothetical protein
MIRHILGKLGYRGIGDAVEFLMCGLATLPALLMLSGSMLSGALALVTLIVLLAAVGMRAPPPVARHEKEADKGDPLP